MKKDSYMSAKKQICAKISLKSLMKATKSIKTTAYRLKEAVESREKVSKRSCSMADQVEMKKFSS